MRIERRHAASCALLLAALLAEPASPARAQSPLPEPSAQANPRPSALPSTPQSGLAGKIGLPPPPQPLVLPPVPDVAPGYSAPELHIPRSELMGVAQTPFVGLSLSDAIAMALARSTELEISQARRRIAGFQIMAAQGAYDIRFQVQPSFQHAVSPPQNPFQSGPNFSPVVENSTGADATLSGVTVGGQRYQVGASGARVDNNATFNSFNPSYPTAFTVAFTQPFGRGRTIDEPRRALALARIGADSSTDDLLLAASNTVSAVENSYWDLVAAWRDLAIQEQALREAAAQQKSNERLARAGVNAPVEILQSNTQVNVFQDNVFSALQNVGRLQNQLKSLILANPADPIWAANLVPTTPVLTLPPAPALTDLVVRAIAQRPELAQLREARRTAEVNAKFAREQLKPQIDLHLGYTTNGFAGQALGSGDNPFFAGMTQQVAVINALVANANRSLPPAQQIPFVTAGGAAPVPSYLQGGLAQSVANLAANRFPTYAAQLQIGLPLGNRTAKANFAIAREQLDALAMQQVALIQRITYEARNALQALRSAEYRLIAARAARQASQAVLASERRRFRAGASTTFLILQRQLELADNRGRELQAQTDLNKAVVEVQRVSGDILSANHIQVETLGSNR